MAESIPSPPQLPPLDCLLAALAVARTGSFSAAAAELGVTHAAISRRIAGAETWAGVALFRRHARGAVATADGERLLSRVAQGIDLIDRAADRGRKVRRPTTVRLATTPSFASHWLLERLGVLEAAAGGLRIELLAEGRLVDLKREEVQLAVRYGDGGWKGGSGHRLFEREVLVPVLARRLLHKAAGRMQPRDVAALPLLHNADSSVWRTWCEGQGMAFRGKPTDRVLSYYHLALGGARAGLGVALMALPLAAELGDDMIALDALAVPDRRHWFLLQHPDAGEAAAAVAKALLQMARR